MKYLSTALLFTLFASLLVAPLHAADAPAAPRPAARIATELCAGCHGPNLVGGSAPNLLDSIWVHGSSDADIRKSITEGFPKLGMVAFGNLLSEAELTSMVSYIRSQATRFAFGGIPYPDPPNAVVFKSEKQEFRLETVAGPFDTPWGMAFLPNGDILVTERPGALRVIRKGKLVAEPVRGTPKAYVRQDSGYLDVTVHPDYAKNGWVYLAYTDSLGEAAAGARPPSMTVIVRGRLRDGAWVDQETIYRAAPEFYYTDTTHYGCRFYWDKQGHLFFTLGERGKATDAQDLRNPLGKIHRVMDDGRTPPDNPFVNQPGAVTTIWSYGNRHVQGLQYHPVTGKMWATEHGPAGGDELNRIDPGRNYGWPVISRGTSFAGETIEGTERAGMEQPVVFWTPTVAPSGITFYTGNRYPAWKNDLFIANLFGRSLRRVVTEGDKVTHQEIVFSEMGRVRTVVQGPDGYLYVLLASPGRVARMVPVPRGTFDREQARLKKAAAALTTAPAAP